MYTQLLQEENPDLSNDTHNLIPRVSHLTAPRGERGETLAHENIRDGSSVIRQFVVLSFDKFKVSRCAATDMTRDV